MELPPLSDDRVAAPVVRMSPPQARHALQQALTVGNTELCEQALGNGADANMMMGHISPLTRACEAGYLEIVKLLCEAKADKERAARDGFSPLAIAARKGDVELARYLVESGAEADRVKMPDGITPLLIAAVNGKVDVVTFLSESG